MMITPRSNKPKSNYEYKGKKKGILQEAVSTPSL